MQKLPITLAGLHTCGLGKTVSKLKKQMSQPEAAKMNDGEVLHPLWVLPQGGG